jgi:hypothetical protein
VFHLSFNTLVFFYFFQCFHVLQFYCKFSSSIMLLLWFCLLWFHIQQLCLLPPIIPSPTSATPCIINTAIFFYLCYSSLPSFGFVLWLQSSFIFLSFFFLCLFCGFVLWLFCFLILFCCFPFSLQLYKLHPTLSFFQHIVVFRCINNMCKMSD